MSDKNLFVSFEDGSNKMGLNPFCESAEHCVLVASPLNEGADSFHAEKTPLIPSTEKELRAFAKMFGWTVKSKMNTLMLVTNVPMNK